MQKCFTVLHLLFFLSFLAASGWAQQTNWERRAALEGTLQRRYTLTKLGGGLLGIGGGENSIQVAGSVVRLLRPGFYGSLQRNQPAFMLVRDGTAEVFRGRKDHEFAPGERLYVHSIVVGSDVITLGLMSARAISTSSGTGRIWAAVGFMFPSETLENADTRAVYAVLDQWMLPEGQASERAEPEMATPPSARVELEPGMTREDVEAALGRPRQEVGFGSRTWLMYAGLVVVLEQNKVVSVVSSLHPPGRVRIESQPAGAEIYVDGSFVGSTPARLELGAGTHAVSIKAPGYLEWKRELRVLAGSEVSLQVSLEK